MSHLGDRISAVLDGQLSGQDSARAMAHLASCRACRDAVEIERLTKDRVAGLAGPEPTGDLVGRLLALGGPSGPLPPRPGHVPGTPRPRPVRLADAAAPVGAGVATLVRPVRTAPPGRPPARLLTSGPGRPGVRHRRARLAVAVLGALGVVGAGVGGLALATPSLSTSGRGYSGVDTMVIQRPPLSAPVFVDRTRQQPIARAVPAFAATLPVPAVAP